MGLPGISLDKQKVRNESTETAELVRVKEE
jgi:hypothetical protein